MFELIESPISIPLNIESAYKRQNEILKRMKFLYTAFDGIKIDFSNKNNMPFIRAGSICMFCYSIYEAKEDIILFDTNENENRYILLKLINNGFNLDVEVVSSLNSYYNEELGGFYVISNDSISKYVPLVITKNDTYNIYYFNIYNNEIY
ncbi:hypothetical protein [Brachyspira pilosicoli]|uniref:hypothetical protein n=1 Tax=Brachyspira pilosicoli TaxID=52584 RepID=UPI00300461FC